MIGPPCWKYSRRERVSAAELVVGANFSAPSGPAPAEGQGAAQIAPGGRGRHDNRRRSRRGGPLRGPPLRTPRPRRPKALPDILGPAAKGSVIASVTK